MCLTNISPLSEELIPIKRFQNPTRCKVYQPYKILNTVHKQPYSVNINCCIDTFLYKRYVYYELVCELQYNRHLAHRIPPTSKGLSTPCPSLPCVFSRASQSVNPLSVYNSTICTQNIGHKF